MRTSNLTIHPASDAFRQPFLVLLLGAMLASSASAARPWEVASREGALTVYKRDVPGSDISEIKAVGIIDAKAHACRNVIDDIAHYTEFMPNTEEARVIRQDGDVIITYQRISAPIIDDRDYTLKKVDKSRREGDKVIYRQEWNVANHLGPPPKEDVVRIKHVKGYWNLEPKGDKTKATYYLHTDPGGSLPSWVVNMANDKVIPRLFKAVERQARKPQYQKVKYLAEDHAPPAPKATASGATAPQAQDAETELKKAADVKAAPKATGAATEGQPENAAAQPPARRVDD